MADKRLLELALKGLELEQQRLMEEIADLRTQITGTESTRVKSLTQAPVKRRKGKLSVAGRQALAEAMRRRWAQYRKGKGQKPGVKAR